MSERVSDPELLRRARGGDESAFRILVERYEPVVSATVNGMLGPGDEADDVGQETFIRFFDALERFREEATVKTYITRIAINLSLNALKRRRRLGALFGSKDLSEMPLPDPGAGPAGEAEARERSEIVRQAIAKLSPKHRAVVTLRMIDGYSTRETAEILEIPEGTVLSRLSRALKSLQTELQPLVES